MQNDTQQHPYSVTGVKSFRGREGYGFNASLHRDGRKVAFVIDEGNGGCNRYEWLAKDADQRRRDATALDDYCLTLPPVEFNGQPLTMDPDTFMGSLVDAHENAKRIASALKKHVLFVEAGELRQSRAAPSDALIAAIRRQHPEAMVLNGLPKGEAVALFTQYAEAR